MLALLTSCGRMDLLKETIDSLLLNQESEIFLNIHEDSEEISYLDRNKKGSFTNIIFTGGKGQHESIEHFLKNVNKEKFYLHLEDDWKFNNYFDWIGESKLIMERDESIIKILCREGSPHPCEHNLSFVSKFPNDRTITKWGYLQPWLCPQNVLWHGFSWNPGVTRLDYLKQFMPFPKWEQDLAYKIWKAGYKVVELSRPVYKHIGEGRSTHF